MVVRAAAVIALIAFGLGVAITAMGGEERVIGAPDIRERVAGYDAKERRLLANHLQRATSRLSDPASELEVAAAINTYLHQLLRLTPLSGNGVETLASAKGYCGNHVTAMLEMLQLVGIDARSGAVLGIRVAGNHSVVEVRFSDGGRGLFDPTHGAFFADDREPVDLERLIENPSLARRALLVDIGKKRGGPGGAAQPIDSIASGYRPAAGLRDRDERELLAKWSDWLTDNRGWSISYSGREMLTPIPVSAGQTWGLVEPAAGSSPWSELASEHQKSGRALPWAFVLGQSDLGYDTAHDFRLAGMTPGRAHVLELYAAQALWEDPAVEVQLPGGRVRRIPLPEFTPNPKQPRVERIEIPFEATGPTASIRTRARGYVLLQGIRLSRAS